jgi:hypothetical protein
MAANVTDSAKVIKKEIGIYGSRKSWQASLVSKIVSQGEAGIDRGLREGRGNRKFREGMIVKEQRVQVLAQRVVYRKFQG